MHIKHLVEALSSANLLEDEDSSYDAIHFKLITYEHAYPQLRESSFLLELALWKSKIDESNTQNAGQNNGLDGDSAVVRGQCRISCGADIIIPNVLPYLIIYAKMEDKSRGD